jgi:hypothetical protein
MPPAVTAAGLITSSFSETVSWGGQRGIEGKSRYNTTREACVSNSSHALAASNLYIFKKTAVKNVNLFIEYMN